MNFVDYPVAASALLVVVTLVPLTAAAGSHERRQLDAHEHGVTTLNIALEDGVLDLELEGPGMNFVGFEHPPRTAGQKEAVAKTLETLNNDSQLFQADFDADCTLVEASAKHITEDDHDEHDSDHDDDHGDHEANHDNDHDEHEAEARHSEFVGQYRYRCTRPERLIELRVGLFERFPLTNEVEASFIGPEIQTFETLTPADPVLNLRP